MTERLIFGARVPGEIYKTRHVVSAVIVEAGGLVAVMRVGARHFLPGGGIEDGESDIETLTREVKEECARAVVIGVCLGQATFHQYAPAYGGWTIHSTYYRAAFGPALDAVPEAEHTLLFLSAADASAVLFRRSDAWAITTALAAGI